MPREFPSRCEARQGRRGIAVLNVLLLAMVSITFLIAATQFLTGNLKAGRQSRGNQQVYAVAKAGIDEALSWMRKQPVKPVTTFDIINDPSPPAPAHQNTLDEQIGLVKEWEIDTQRHLWGRFEVGRSFGSPTRTTATAAYATNGTLYPAAANYRNGDTTQGLDWAAQDISLQRGKSQAGSVWLLRSRGYIFQRAAGETPDTQPFSLTDASERPIQKIELETEVNLTSFSPPAAALYNFDAASDTGQVAAHTQCAITGGHINVHGNGAASNVVLGVKDGAGVNIWCASNPSDVHLHDDAGSNLFGPSLTGQSNNAKPNYVSSALADQLQSFFGVSDVSSLKGLADYVYDVNSPPPAVLPQMAFIFVDATGMANGEMLFDGTANALTGGGVLFVNGGIALDGTTTSQVWDGPIFATGWYHQFNKSKVTGGVTCGARSIVHGESGKVAQLYYSQATLSDVVRQVSNYAEQRSTFSVVPGSSEDVR